MSISASVVRPDDSGSSVIIREDAVSVFRSCVVPITEPVALVVKSFVKGVTALGAFVGTSVPSSFDCVVDSFPDLQI